MVVVVVRRGEELCSSLLRNFVMPVKEVMAPRKHEATKIYHIPDWNVQITTFNPPRKSESESESV